MTNFTTRILMAAATVVVAAGAASAQSLKADIPFAFRAGKQVMPAGSYRLSDLGLHSGTTAFRIQSIPPAAAVVLLPSSTTDAKEAWERAGSPILKFECAAATCVLSGVWTGNGMPLYNLPHPALKGETTIALIPLLPAHTD